MARKTNRDKNGRIVKIPNIEIPETKERVGMKNIKPLTIGQSKYLDLIKNKKLVIVTSSAGCGKTCLASRYAAQELIKENYKKIVITRPNIGAEINELGHLPGSVIEKMNMFIRPVLDELVSYGLTNQEITQKLNDNIIEVVPFFYMQGRSFIDSIIIAEEIQNCTYNQILLLITRFSRRSKLILTSDPTNSYLPKNERVDLDSLGLFLSNKIPDVGYIHLEDKDIVREVLVQDVLGCIDEWKNRRLD